MDKRIVTDKIARAATRIVSILGMHDPSPNKRAVRITLGYVVCVVLWTVLRPQQPGIGMIVVVAGALHVTIAASRRDKASERE